MPRRWFASVVCIAILTSLVLFPQGQWGYEGDDTRPLDYPMKIVNGTAVTVYVWDWYLDMRTFSILEVLGGTISYVTEYNETISLWSDGEYLTIHCSRPFIDGNGCHIGGAQLNGIPGYPPRIWASVIVNYTLGIGGNESTLQSIVWRLGEAVLGDGNTSITLGFQGVEDPGSLVWIDLEGPSIGQVNETLTLTATAPQNLILFRWDIPADRIYDTDWRFALTGKDVLYFTFREPFKACYCVNAWDGLDPQPEKHRECASIEIVERRSPRAPRILSATLVGTSYEDVLVNWTLSDDDPWGIVQVERYDVYRGESYSWNGSGYLLHDSLPPGTSSYIDSTAGEGNPMDYFYRVCAYNSTNFSGCAENQAAKLTHPLFQELSLVSVPLIQSNESIEIVLQTLLYDKAWSYDSLNQEWNWYMKQKTYKGGLLNIDHTTGLWLNVTEDSNLTVAGIVPAQTTIQLHKGWNLVSFPSFLSFSVSDLKSIAPVERVEGFDSSAPPHFLRVLVDSDVFLAGQGYWVKTSEDATWVVSNG